MTEHFETRSKKGRGMAQRSLDLIEAMYAKAEAAHPITGRGIGYKLLTAARTPSLARAEVHRVYRLCNGARERGRIPWEWIVDETRAVERTPTWANPAAYARCVARSYRRDFWNQQPVRCEVWSEKGTVRGVLGPVLDHYAVGFRVIHGFSSATTVYDVSQDDDGRELIALYVGDFDPSGLYMSEEDLPTRLRLRTITISIRLKTSCAMFGVHVLRPNGKGERATSSATSITYSNSTGKRYERRSSS